MSFSSPLWLLALVIVPALVVGYILRERRRVSDAARFASPALLPNVVDHRPGIRRHLPVAVLLLAFSLLIVGVARPHATVKVPREEATVILAVDVSNSMRANDVKPTRLAAAQAAAEAFAAKVPKKFQVGVVTFASRATVALPPTTDRTLVHTALDSLHSSGGTALGDAVALSTQLVQRQRTVGGTVPPAAVLLISDGKQDGGRTTAAAAAAKAKAAHIPVYTVVVGTPNGRIQQKLTGGYTATIQVPANPTDLETLAKATGGQFYAATSDSRVSSVYKHLGSRLGHRTINREMTDVVGGIAALLLLVGGGMSAFWFRRVIP
ncbi:MAG: VWA domain-containing protein [Gaiellaceae bacterium]